MVAGVRQQDRQASALFDQKQQVLGIRGNARVVAIASGKGGVGKSNVAANLAISLAKHGKRVMVFDADLGLANVDILLGIRAEHNLRDVVSGRSSLADILIQAPGGIWVAPGGCGLAELVGLDAFGRGRLLRQLAEVENVFDYILIDAAAGVGEDVIQFLRAVGEIIVVTTPEPTAITDAYALIKVTALEAPESKFNLIVNNAQNEQEGQAAAARLERVTKQFLGVRLNILGILPHCDKVPTAVREQVPVTIGYPDSTFSRAIAVISKQISGTNAQDRNNLQSGLSQAVHRFFQRWTGREAAL